MSNLTRRIGLEQIRFVAPIGYFEEERVLKNEFLVDVFVEINISDVSDLENLDNTVDYSKLYEICELHFRAETKLIETVAHSILDDIKLKFSFVENIKITIRKKNPPIKAEILNSLVELSFNK